MYNLLIVDDEMMICRGIQVMIKRKFADIFTSFIANDGLEALEILRERNIDLVITDIKMPRMDGLKLIKKVYEKKPSLKFIILSGYDEFQYAREAIKYNVCDYLLKPIKRNELYEVIQKTIDEIEEENRKKIQHEEYVSSQLNYIFVNPAIKEEEIANICKKIGFEERGESYVLSVIHIREKINRKQLIKSLQNFSPQCLQEKKTVIVTDHHGDLVIITYDKQLVNKLKDFLSKKEYTFATGVSSEQISFKKLKEAYSQAKHALKYRLILPEKIIYYYQQFPKSHTKDFSQFHTEKLKKILNMLGEDKKEQKIKNILKEIFNTIADVDEKIEFVESFAQVFNQFVINDLLPMLGKTDQASVFENEKFSDIYRFKDIVEYQNSVETYILKCHQELKQIKNMDNNQIHVLKAIKFIQENFHKDINLAVVSNYVSLNYSYFSNLFKEYTGVSFTDYLKKLRIEKSKKLLLETDYKIYEIAEMVGFTNPKHFTKVFRSLEGISPKEYRGKWIKV